MLFLSIHALDQMKLRQIGRAEIIEALASPETTYVSEDSDEKRVILGTTRNGRRLKTVVLADDANFIVTVADRDTTE